MDLICLGEMFIKSAADDTLQGKAIKQIHNRWAIGEENGDHKSIGQNHKNRAHIGIPVRRLLKVLQKFIVNLIYPL